MWFRVTEDLRLVDQLGEIVNTDTLPEVIDQGLNVGFEQTRLKRCDGAGPAAAGGVRRPFSGVPAFEPCLMVRCEDQRVPGVPACDVDVER